VKVIMVDKEKCTGCHQCELWCGTEIASTARELAKAINEQPQPIPRVYVEGKPFALQCRHCEDAPCVAVCPSGALKKNAPGYPVHFERALCIGCKKCVIACPFGVVTMDRDGKHVLKCDLCVERLKLGQKPACASACHTGALTYQTADEMAQEKRTRTLRDYLVTLGK